MNKYLLTALLSLSVIFSLGVVANAQDDAIDDSPDDEIVTSFNIPNPFKSSVGGSLYGLIQNIMNDIILPIGGVLCVLAFIYAGFMYVTAQGDETKIKNAHNTLLYAAIGTAVLLGSWVLATAICKTIGALGGPVCTF